MARARSVLLGGWRWWLHKPSEVDEARVRAEPLALIGDLWCDLPTWALKVDPSRPVIDLRTGRRERMSVARMRLMFGERHKPILLSDRLDRVAIALQNIAQPYQVITQPYYVRATPLRNRPQDALELLHLLLIEQGCMIRLRNLGPDNLARLASYDWPRDLHELREVSTVLAAFLEARGNLTQTGRLLQVSRQATAKCLALRGVYGDGRGGEP